MHVLRNLYTPYVTYFWAALRNADFWMAYCVFFHRVLRVQYVSQEKHREAILCVSQEEHDWTIFSVPLNKHWPEKYSLQPYTHAYKTWTSHYFRALGGTRWDLIYVPLKKHCLEMDSLHPYTHAYKTLRSHHFPVPRGTRWDHYFRAPKQTLSGAGQSAALHACLKML